MFLKQFPGRPRRFSGYQWVEDDPARLAAHEADVRKVETANLVDARDHLVEPVVVIQPGLAVQRGMDAVEFDVFDRGIETAPCPKRHGRHPP